MIIALVLWFCVAACSAVYTIRRERKLADEYVAEFVEGFPGRCPICSFHRMGKLHGHAGAGELAPLHAGCPEQ